MEKNAELLKQSSEIIKALSEENNKKNLKINELSEKISGAEKDSLIEKYASIMEKNSFLEKEEIIDFKNEMNKLSIQEIKNKMNALDTLGIDEETGDLEIGKSADQSEISYEKHSLKKYLFSK